MKRLICLLCILLICVPVYADEAEIKGKAAVLIDAKSGEVIFEQNSNEKLPIASLTEIMTLLLSFEAIEKGELSLDETLTAGKKAVSFGGSDIWLKEGENMSVNDLIKAVFIMGASDAAAVLSEKIGGSAEEFTKLMNQRAGELKMENTVFKNPCGINEEGQYSTALDTALMAKELISHEKIFDYTLTWMDYIRGGETQIVNTNKLIRSYKGITGLKTGTDSSSGSCICASAKRGEVSLIAVILGCESSEERFSSAAKLLDFGFENYSSASPERENVNEISVEGGMKKSVSLAFPKEESFLVKKGETVTAETELPEKVKAPVFSGDTAGKVIYKKGESVILERDIKFSQSVEAISFSKVFLYLISLIKCT